MKTIFTVLMSLCLSVALCQEQDSAKTMKRQKVGGIFKKVGSGLSAAGQKVAGSAAQLTGTIIQNSSGTKTVSRSSNVKGNTKNCIWGDCKNGIGTMKYPVSDNKFIVVHGSFKNGGPDGWIGCTTVTPSNYGDSYLISHGFLKPYETPMLLEFRDGQRTGNAKISQLVGVRDGLGNIVKYARSGYYEGTVNENLRPHGFGKYFFDTAYYGKPVKPLLYVDSLISEDGVWKSAARINEYDRKTHSITEVSQDVIFMPNYPNQDQSKQQPIINETMMVNMSFPKKGRKVMYYPDGKVRQTIEFLDKGSNNVSYQSAIMYDEKGEIVYSGMVDQATLNKVPGKCLSGNCVDGEGVYRWIAYVSENYVFHSERLTPAIMVTKGKFRRKWPTGEHHVRTSLGSDFTGTLTPDFYFKWGTVVQGNVSYQGSFGDYNNIPSGGMKVVTGVKPGDFLYTVAGIGISIVKSSTNSLLKTSGGSVVISALDQKIASQFIRDMHVGTTNKDYSQLEAPVKMVLLDSSLTVGNIELTYQIHWGQGQRFETDIRAKSVYDPVQEDIRIEYTILREEEAAKNWRIAAQAFEKKELAKIGIKVGSLTGELSARQGKSVLWRSDVTYDADVRNEWAGYDYRGNAVYEKVQTERTDRFIDTYKLPVAFYCNDKPVGTITCLIFNEIPNMLSSGSVMSWAGAKLLMGLGGLQQNTVFAGQYGYINLGEAISDMSIKVQRHACKMKD